MRIVSHPVTGGVNLTAAGAELARLASLIAAGRGSLSCASSPSDRDALLAVEVTGSAGSGVRVHVDTGRRVLLITGDPAARAILAGNLHWMAEMQRGGHLHVDYFPHHPYLSAGSLPLMVKSPAGMPGFG